MKVYHYDDNGFYINESDAYLDDEETIITGNDVWVLPASATFIEPPTLVDYQVAQFINGAWEIVPDFRGELIYQGDQVDQVTEVGALPNGWQLEPTQDYLTRVAREEMKATREATIAALVVTVSGMQFDADDFSQNRMLAAITAADINQASTVGDWILADNSVATDLSLTTLKAALAAAVAATSAVWLNS